MFRPLQANITSRFGYSGGGIKFKVANGTGKGSMEGRDLVLPNVLYGYIGNCGG